MIMCVVMLDGGIGFDLFETKQLPETVRDVHRGAAHGVARTTATLGGRVDLDPIQAIFVAGGRSGRTVEELAGRTDLIS